MKVFIALLLLASCGLAGNSVRSQITKGVEYWLTRPELPDLASGAFPGRASEDPLYEDVTHAFKRLHDRLFPGRKNLFKLSAFSGDIAFIHLGSRTVFINPEILKILKTNVPFNEYISIVTLIIAHEFGHYFYELQTTYSQSGTSFLGQSSYVYGQPLSSATKARMHGEVDAIGIYLASKIGIEPSLGLKAVMYVNQAIQISTRNMISLSEIEVEGRLKLIKEYLAHPN